MGLKQRIKNWLFKEEIEKIETLILDVTNLKYIEDNAIEKYAEAKSLLSAATVEAIKNKKLMIKSTDELNECRKFINKICDVGVDVGFGDEHSWAVICVAGKPEYVKFMPLTHRDTMEIVKFLKHFQYSNKVIDSPFGYRKMLDDLIIKGES